MSASSVFRWRHADMFFKVLTKERLVGEVEFLGYFLYALLSVAQEHTQLHRNIRVYPIVWRALRHCLHCLRQIFRRDAQLFGIPSNTAFATEIILYKLQELREDVLGACLALVVLGLHRIDDITHLVDHREEHRLHQLTAEMIIRFVYLHFHALEGVAQKVSTLPWQPKHGMGA